MLLSCDPFPKRKQTATALITGHERSMDKELQALQRFCCFCEQLLCSSVLLNVITLQLPTGAGGKLLFQYYSTKQPTAEVIICILFTPTHAWQVNVTGQVISGFRHDSMDGDYV